MAGGPGRPVADRVVGIAAEAVAEIAVRAVLQVEDRQARDRPVAAPGDGGVDDPVPDLRGESAYPAQCERGLRLLAPSSQNMVDPPEQPTWMGRRCPTIIMVLP